MNFDHVDKWDGLRDLVPFVQFISLLHWGFSRFLNCTNTWIPLASPLFQIYNKNDNFKRLFKNKINTSVKLNHFLEVFFRDFFFLIFPHLPLRYLSGVVALLQLKQPKIKLIFRATLIQTRNLLMKLEV